MEGRRKMIDVPDLIPALNTSKALSGILFRWMDQYHIVNPSILVIEEPCSVKEFFNNILGYNNIDIIKHNDIVNNNKFDINILTKLNKEYDIVYSQALIEHVCRPSIAIENLCNFTKVGGLVFLHAACFKHAYHAHPIDCVRFYNDFFVNLTNYLPLEVLEYEETANGLHCVYRKGVNND